jgi:predicted adenylyl cyclase CyaB
MKKPIEVELRALVKDLNVVRNNITKSDAKYIGSSTIYDIYFCIKSISTIEEVEMHDVGSYSLRLRDYSRGKTKSITLNTKTITKLDDHHAWEEHEVEVKDFDETSKILIGTEFKPYFELKKIRHEYKLGNLGIFLEEIEDFGGALEIEILTTPGLEESSKEKILEYLEKIGVSKEEVVPKSVTNIVMKQRAFKTDIVV